MTQLSRSSGGIESTSAEMVVKFAGHFILIVDECTDCQPRFALDRIRKTCHRFVRLRLLPHCFFFR